MTDSVRTLQVSLQERTYPIWIGQGVLEQAAHYLEKRQLYADRTLMIVSDGHVADLYAKTLQRHLQQNGYVTHLCVVPSGEASKSLQMFERVMTEAIEARLDRKSVILALGGGVVGDLAGFVASTYMRGIPFVQLPTTLLAHDSSVGGKVAINHSLGKNIIGAFYQPQCVLYDTQTLQTLPERQVRSGWAEVLKLGLIWDESFVQWLDEHASQLLALEEPYLSEALYQACAIKSEIVSQDETEQGLRALLNLGHTFGHAFEALGHYEQLTHGEAVAIGMVLAAKTSEVWCDQPGLIGMTETTETHGMAKRVRQLFQRFGLPTDWQGLPWQVEEVIDKMYSDKKVTQGQLRFILLSKIGKAKVVDDVSPALIQKVWAES